MPILAFIVAVAAGAAFAVEVVQSRSAPTRPTNWVAVGLLLLDLALILQFIIRTDDNIVTWTW